MLHRSPWAHANFNDAPERGEPGGAFVDGHALHAASENLGKCGLVGVATLSA